MAYADISDLVVELGRSAGSVTDAEDAQWGSWLDRVERKIKRGFQRRGFDLIESINTGSTDVADVRDVEVAVVARRVRAESLIGLTSITRSIDDASVTERREGAEIDDEILDLTDDEWSTILPDVESLGAWTIRPYGASDNGFR